MWDLGVVLAQMLYGLDVVDRFMDPEHLISTGMQIFKILHNASRRVNFMSAVGADTAYTRLLSDLLQSSSKARPSAPQVLSRIQIATTANDGQSIGQPNDLSNSMHPIFA